MMKVPGESGIVSQTETEHSRRLWLMSWLAKRPDVLARLVTTYRRMRRWSVARRRRLSRGAAVTVAGAALLLALSSAPAGAEGITVVNGEVAVSNNGLCSLREAINNANNVTNGVDFDDCAARSPTGPNIIVLPEDGLFTFNDNDATSSETALPLITSTVTIEGNGSTFRRSAAAGNFRFLAINDDVHLTVNDVTMESATRGAIYGRGDLTLNDSTIQQNSQGAVFINGGSVEINRSVVDANSGNVAAIYAIGDLTITDSTITNNVFTSASGNGGFGGGISLLDGELNIVDSVISNNDSDTGRGGGIAVRWADGATIENSIISGNSSEYGGGLYVQVTSVTIISSTISQNEAGNRGGGIYQNGGELFVNESTISRNKQGGLCVFNAQVEVNNSTISGNTSSMSGGGVFNENNEFTLRNSTVVNNVSQVKGGGIYFSALYGELPFTIEHTLITNNGAPQGPQFFGNSADSMVVNRFNLFGADGQAGIVGFLPGATDLVPAVGTTAEQILALTLADNGGPTPTLSLVPGSPAIDAVPSAACAGLTDQRGYARNADGDDQPSDKECDIGALEFNSGPPPRWDAFVPITVRP